jgi:hypothetical protein
VSACAHTHCVTVWEYLGSEGPLAIGVGILDCTGGDKIFSRESTVQYVCLRCIFFSFLSFSPHVVAY